MANAVMEKRAREIFRATLALFYVEGVDDDGDRDKVTLWLQHHGGWFPDPQEDYGYGSLMPLADGPDVMSKEPEKATKDAQDVTQFFTDVCMCDGVAEQMGCLDLKASAKLWLEDLAKEVAPAPEAASSSAALTEANVEAHDFRIEFAHEILQSVKDRKEQTEQRGRSRSPRRCVIPEMTVAVMKKTMQLKDQMIEALQGKLLARDRELIEKNARVADLEAKLESNERLIDLKDKLVERMMDMIRSR